MSQFSRFTEEDVRDYVKKEISNISAEVLESIISHKIDGEVFMEIEDEAYLTEIAPIVGDRIKLKKAIRSARNMVDKETLHPLSQSKNNASISTSAINRVRHSSSAYSRSQSSSPVPYSSSASTPCSLFDFSDGDTDDHELDNESSQLPCSEENSTAVHNSGDIASCSSSSPKAVLKQECTKGPPPPPLDWAEKISIPQRFSAATNAALSSGIPTRSARDEIVNALATQILVYTIEPSSDDRTTVCKKLVQKIPVLKDHCGSGYDSWKKKLNTKFKNLRRPSRAEKAGIKVPPVTPSPPPKRVKRNPIEISPSDSDIAEYDQHIKFIQKSYKSGKWSSTSMFTLMQQTASLRRQWIIKESPTVQAVLEMFPCLQDPTMIIMELCDITGLNKDDVNVRWSEVEKKVLNYATKDERKSIKDIILRYNSGNKEGPDRTTAYVLQLLSMMLCPRSAGKKFILMTFEGETINIEESLQSIQFVTPVITAYGQCFDELSDFAVVIEKDTVLKMPTLATALHCCFATYYIYNISYPAHFAPFFLFLELYIYQMSPSKKVPTSVSVVVECIEKA